MPEDKANGLVGRGWRGRWDREGEHRTNRYRPDQHTRKPEGVGTVGREDGECTESSRTKKL